MKTDVFFVPETRRASELLNEMQRANRRMAIVVDEYGGVAGLVTVEDLIEEIVGELSNEGELRNEAIRESDNSYIVLGSLEADRLEELLGLRLAEDWHATTRDTSRSPVRWCKTATSVLRFSNPPPAA
jgi:putative hemolysin